MDLHADFLFTEDFKYHFPFAWHLSLSIENQLHKQ